MSLLKVHDEHIDDTMYMRGWTDVSVIKVCKARGCKCERGRRCISGMFNHYLVEDCASEPLGQRPEPSVFPICLTPENAETCGMEEIRCMRHTLGTAWRYYKTNVLRGLDTTTLLSCALDGYKSPCFNIPCYLIHMPRKHLPEGSAAIAREAGDDHMIIARDDRLSASLMESICYTGVSPLVSDDEFVDVTTVNSDGSTGMRRLWYTSFAFPLQGPNMLTEPSLESRCDIDPESIPGARAVQTALITVSVLLTPKSIYGGKNPSTKLLTYFVHNICHGDEPEGN